MNKYESWGSPHSGVVKGERDLYGGELGLKINKFYLYQIVVFDV